MSVPKQLSDVNWKLLLQLSHSKMANTKTPSAQVEFSLSDSAEGKPQQLVVEFTKEELMEFYNKLEEMQGQLDALL